MSSSTMPPTSIAPMADRSTPSPCAEPPPHRYNGTGSRNSRDGRHALVYDRARPGRGLITWTKPRVFQFSEEALDWGYEHDGTSAKPARRPGFGAGPPGIARTASSSTSHPDAGRLRHALRGPQPLRDSSMGPPARCRHGAGHGFHPAQDASGGQPPYRIPSAGRGRLRDRSGRVEPGGTAGRERHCGGRQSLAGDSRPRVARGAPGGRICSRIQPGGRAKGGWGRYRGN